MGVRVPRPHQTTRIRATCRATDLAGIDAVRSDRSQAGRNADTGKNVLRRGLPSDGREAEHEHGENPERALWRLGRIWLVFCRLFMTARRRSRHRGGQGPAAMWNRIAISRSVQLVSRPHSIWPVSRPESAPWQAWRTIRSLAPVVLVLFDKGRERARRMPSHLFNVS